MKLKYYLRGLGIGVIVTALLMGFATKGGNELSDEEIKARAMELGMVEQRTLADIRDNAESGALPKNTEAPTEVPAMTEALEGADDIRLTPQGTDIPMVTDRPIIPQDTAMPDTTDRPVTPQGTVDIPATPQLPQATDAPTTPLQGTEESQPPMAEVLGDMVQVTIFEGNNSVNVSRVLEEAGLVESATAFDRYLRDNGYSKIINMGSYEIPMGTGEEEIAHIITNTN